MYYLHHEDPVVNSAVLANVHKAAVAVIAYDDQTSLLVVSLTRVQF